jgi:hypothetical protein
MSRALGSGFLAVAGAALSVRCQEVCGWIRPAGNDDDIGPSREHSGDNLAAQAQSGSFCPDRRGFGRMIAADTARITGTLIECDRPPARPVPWRHGAV